MNNQKSEKEGIYLSKREYNQILVHSLKLDEEYFSDVASGFNKFEIRKDDRPYEEGDILFLQEYRPNDGYTGEYCFARITNLFGREEHEKEYVKDGFVTLGINLIKEI